MLKPKFLSTKSFSLNKLLNGGLPLRELSLIYGEASTGKTTLVLQTAIEAAKNLLKVLYIDVDYSFTPQRFNQIAGLHANKASPNIFIFTPKTFFEQTQIIENWEKRILEDVQKKPNDFYGYRSMLKRMCVNF
ncbi:MAG: AAA family ATPase [Candidatus Bathyarchaeia archaeon]